MMNRPFPMAIIAKALGVTVQAGNQRAQREQWASQKKPGRGGGREYLFATLPPDVQVALLRVESREIMASSQQIALPSSAPTIPILSNSRELDPAVKTAGDAAAAQLRGNAKARMEAKLTLVEAFSSLTGDDLAAAIVRYNTGEWAGEGDPHAVIHRLSITSMYRWRDQSQRLGMARLAGKYGNRRGDCLIARTPEFAAALRGLIFDYPHVRATVAHEWLAARYAESAWNVPSLSAVRRWLNHWREDNAELFTRISNPDAWKNKYMIGWGDADASIVRLNQRWEFDSTPADVMLVDGRHSILGVIDVYSRRVMLHVSKTSRAAAVASLIRRALLEWGVPEIAKTDNGQEYVSKHVKRIFQSLDIEQQLSHPFSPWEKPHIERFFRTFSHDLIEYLPGYVGHNVAEREELRARQQFSDRLFAKDRTVELQISAEDLQIFCDAWTLRYHSRVHSELKMTPLERLASWTEPTRHIADVRVLDLLLAEAPGDGWRTVTKSYGLLIDRYKYSHEALAVRVGERVRVLYDPEGDLGRVFVFDERGQYLCIAECPELTGISRQELARASKAGQLANMRQKKSALRSDSRRTHSRDALEQLCQQRAEFPALPAPTEPHASAGVTRAQQALDAQQPRADEKVVADGQAWLERQKNKPTPPVSPRGDTATLRYQYWTALQAKVHAAEGDLSVIAARDRHWFDTYPASNEFRSQKRLAAEIALEEKNRRA